PAGFACFTACDQLCEGRKTSSPARAAAHALFLIIGRFPVGEFLMKPYAITAVQNLHERARARAPPSDPASIATSHIVPSSKKKGTPQRPFPSDRRACARLQPPPPPSFPALP